MRKHLLLIPRKLFFLLLSLFFLANPHAQPVPSSREDIPVTIKVINQKKEPVESATISIVNRFDSLQSKEKETDSSGIATFKLVIGEQYIVKISSVNYEYIEKGITITGNDNFFSFTIEPLPKTLENVKIISQKPLMRQEDDKTIIETENLAAASTSGFEVIEKTPGLFVDQDGNIYISSLTPATIQINGREMKMSAPDVATMLKSLPPDAITRIEVVRTPSAKYDANSSGGIVNVVLRKRFKIGMTGSFNSGFQQGTYGNQFIGFNLNNNVGKKSSYINLNISNRDSYEKIVTDRIFAPDTVLGQNAFTKYPATTYFAGYGLTYEVEKKWEIDFSGNINLNDFNNRTKNQNDIRKISTNQLLSGNRNIIVNDGTTINLRNSLSAKLKIDTIGSEWTNDILFNFTKNKSEQKFAAFYDDPFSTITGGGGTIDNRRNYFNAQSDLKLKMKKKLTLETGVKSSLLSFKSETDFYKEVPPGNRQKDPGRTNTFNYYENINAFYLQGSKTFGKDIVLKTGVRLENTNMEGNQIIPSDTSFNIHRTDLFPYIYLSKNLMKIMGYELRAYLVYRRTIRRPVYEQLNPFPRYIDQYLSEAGNPSLRPQFTTNYEANVSVDERPILAFGVNATKDIFTNVIYQSDTSQRQAYRTYDNLGENKEWYLRGLGAIPPGKKYFIVIGAQYNHNFYQGLYENKPLSFKRGTWTFFTYQTFRFDKRSQITLNGFIRLKGQLQFYELSSFGALNTSINRKFLKEKLIVTLSLSDIFATYKNDFTLQQGSVSASGFRQADTRRFGINLRYNFGIKKKENNNNILDVVSPERTN